MRGRRWVGLGAGAAMLLGGLSPVSAAPGDLDATFGDDGIVVEGTPTVDRGAAAGTLLPNGKLVIVGYEPRGGDDYDVRLVQLNSDGSLDTGFGEDGVVIRNFLITDVANAVAAAPGGKIVVVGTSNILLPAPGIGQPVDEVTVAMALRFNADGSPDETFGNDGVAFVNAIFYGNPVEAVFTDVAVQPDGKIVAVGSQAIPGNPFIFTVVRFDEDGELDTDFDTDGIRTVDLQYGGPAEAVELQPDGKIVAAGTDFTVAGGRMTAVRLEDDGSLDPDFGTGGIALVELDGFKYTEVDNMALAPAEAIVLEGFAIRTNDEDFGILVRLGPDGSVDTTFGADGVVPTETVAAIAVQGDGKILASIFDDAMTVTRYNADGSPDSSFGEGGTVAALPGGSGYFVGAQADGKVVLGGDVESNNTYAFAAVRFEGAPAKLCDGQTVTVDLAAGDTPTQGADVIVGTRGPDVINGLRGGDLICGLGGADIIGGGGGPDRILGGAGPDTLNGGGGADTLLGGPRRDILNGGRGQDTCAGGRGNDSLASCESGS